MAFPSEWYTTNKRARMLNSCPECIVNLIPEWAPTQLLQVGDSVVKAALIPPYIASVLIEGCVTGDVENMKKNLFFEDLRRRRRIYKEEENWKVRVLSQRRRSSKCLELRSRKMADQLQSPFFKLPEEIRCMIYAHFLSGKRFHVQESYRRFGFVECHLGADHSCRYPVECIKDQLDLTIREPNVNPINRLAMSRAHKQKLKYKPKPSAGFTTTTPVDELLALGKTCRLA
jgi:hypothetical protein